MKFGATGRGRLPGSGRLRRAAVHRGEPHTGDRGASRPVPASTSRAIRSSTIASTCVRTHSTQTSPNFLLPVRRLSRGGDCVRWISGPSMQDWGRLRPVRGAGSGLPGRPGGHRLRAGRRRRQLFRGDQRPLHVPAHRLDRVRTGRRADHHPPVSWFLEGSLDDLLRRRPGPLAQSPAGPRKL